VGYVYILLFFLSYHLIDTRVLPADDWLSMVRRYKDNKRVVGADLYNEVRRSILTDPSWGAGDSADWYDASHWVGDRILFEANPDLLIIVEGINWTGVPVDGFPHGRPTLSPVRGLSHSLIKSNKVRYFSAYPSKFILIRFNL